MNSLAYLSNRRRVGRWLLLTLLLGTLSGYSADAVFQVGVARREVTPSTPIRLTGYAVRKTESTGVAQKLWVKAVAISGEDGKPVLLLSLDNCGIAESTYLQLVERLQRSAGLPQERLALCLSHTHAGPATDGWAPNIFAQDIPADQLETIRAYTRGLVDQLEAVALDALRNRQSAGLAWAQGTLDFARNRRTPGGPVDPALPVLRVTDAQGKVLAFIANYACHCTTLGGDFNQTHGDWAGCAQEYLEEAFPGSLAMITIGCGADANPSPRGGPDFGLALAQQHGRSLVAEIKRLMEAKFTPLRADPVARLKPIGLPFDQHFTRAQWEERAGQGGIVGYHARKNLARLDRGETLPETLSYYVQTWTFGEQLALVFLNGEVVVDYDLRLKKDFDPARLWVTAYANYVPCYIPSRRILSEGGYEAETSLWYYDRPQRLSPATEALIIATVHKLIPASFLAEAAK